MDDTPQRPPEAPDRSRGQGRDDRLSDMERRLAMLEQQGAHTLGMIDDGGAVGDPEGDGPEIPLHGPSFVRIDRINVVGGKDWLESTWSRPDGVTDVLYVPYDGVTAPTYKTARPAMTALPAGDGSDDRATGLYIDLARTPGPDFIVMRG